MFEHVVRYILAPCQLGPHVKVALKLRVQVQIFLRPHTAGSLRISFTVETPNKGLRNNAPIKLSSDFFIMA